MCNLILAVALSQHLGLVGDYNEIHPSAQCRFDNGVVAGAFLNSEDNVSAFLAYRWEGRKAWAELGLATGYSDADIVPFGRVGVWLGERASLFAAPAYETWNGEDRWGAVIGLEIEIGG